MKLLLFIILLLPLTSREAAGQVVDHSRCDELATQTVWLGDHYQFQQQYDTAKEYINSCYNEENSWKRFSYVTAAAVGLEAVGDTVWQDSRTWLRSVLYLNPDSNYFCADLEAYAATFQKGRTPDLKTAISIIKYLADSSYCKSFNVSLKYLWKTYHYYWADTAAADAVFDSTIPSLDDIGESWIRGFQRSVSQNDFTIYPNAVSQLSATNNPFTDEIELHYSVTKPTVAKIEIYDALGRMLWTDGQGYLEPRQHLSTINTAHWSSGTYYARIITLQGEVKSLKLVKE